MRIRRENKYVSWKNPSHRPFLVALSFQTDIWHQKYNGPMIKIITIPEEFGTLSNYPDDYNRLLLSDFLWKETIQCENVLVTQTDATIFRHGIEDFFEYDYVGSPIYPESFPTRFWRIMNAYQDTGIGGNGGLSFRKRSSMIEALDNCPIPIPGSPEDAWSAACMMLLNKTLPHPTIANRFSVGTKCEVDFPLGGHKLWMNCNRGACEAALLTSRMHFDIYGEQNADRECPEGEAFYRNLYPGDGHKSGWKQYNKMLQKNPDATKPARLWRCFYNNSTAVDHEERNETRQ